MTMEYVRPKNIKEALQTLKRGRRKARLIAGGTNLIPDMRAMTLTPSVLIDLSHLKTLSYIRDVKGEVRIGGLTAISELAASKVIQRVAPILSEAARQIGNPLVRNRATLAGNLADASPAADTAVPLLVLDARVVAEREGAKPRQVPIDQFFTGPNRTVLRKDEMILEVDFPAPRTTARMAYLKLGLRNSMAISVVSIAALMEIEKGKCRKVRIGLGAVAPKPMRAYETEKILLGNEVTRERIEACCETIEKEVSPITDIRAGAGYRRSMVSVLLRRVLQKLILVDEK
jgi:CO/xanthine dehydrogenase FAD-binding subunit